MRGGFDGGTITSDAGGLLLREVEKRTGIIRQFAACFRDHRQAERIEHEVEELVAQRKRPGYQARRWVVERTHSWLNRFRKLLVSFEKTKEGYVALLALAAAMICWRQTITIYG